MARKKKEEIKEQPEAVQAELAPEQKTEEVKKTVKRARTPKNPAQKSVKQAETPQTPMAAESPVAEKEETTEVKAEVKPQKPKRGRKPAVKKTEEPKAEEKPVEKAQELAPAVEEGKQEVKKTATRAEKNETIKSLIKEMLGKRPYKWSELLDESAKLYAERIEEKDGHVANDVRGRVGSVFDVMKKDGEVVFEGGVYALKKTQDEPSIEKLPVKEEKTENPTQKETKTEVLQESPVPAPAVAVETTEKNKQKQLPVVKKKAELAPVFDMTLLLSDKNDKNKPAPVEPVKENVTQKTAEAVPVVEPKATEVKKENKKPEAKKPEPKKVELKKPEIAKEPKQPRKVVERRNPKTAESKLKEVFLKKIRALGGRYFEFYSIYLLERYSLRNGRRVDGFKVSGGENDGGIDGELEVTDRIGFKETIYVQAKNWKPIYGKEDSWVIGETALREFIGAVAYRQAKEGKQRCRGIFITTSYFTAGSKEILEKMSDQFVGYDGDDLFEAAKECSFGLIQENGEWKLDERLFVGEKAFFNLYQ